EYAVSGTDRLKQSQKLGACLFVHGLAAMFELSTPRRKVFHVRGDFREKVNLYLFNFFYSSLFSLHMA
ncbi:MAG: hypothetical protein AAFY21_02040, partial [Cyanobacteria bacterium J06641_2]